MEDFENQRIDTVHLQTGPTVYIFEWDMFLPNDGGLLWRVKDLPEVQGTAQGMGLETIWWDGSEEPVVNITPEEMKMRADRIREAGMAPPPKTPDESKEIKLVVRMPKKQGKLLMSEKGSAKSGNRGHAGIPGHQGGSAPKSTGATGGAAAKPEEKKRGWVGPSGEDVLKNIILPAAAKRAETQAAEERAMQGKKPARTADQAKADYIAAHPESTAAQMAKQPAANDKFAPSTTTIPPSKTFYHGTTSQAQVDAIKSGGFPEGSGANQIFGKGVYLTDDKNGATKYGQHVVNAHLNVKNTAVFDSQGQFHAYGGNDVVRKAGYDSMIIHGATGSTTVVFDPKNIKVTGAKPVATTSAKPAAAAPDIKAQKRDLQKQLNALTNQIVYASGNETARLSREIRAVQRKLDNLGKKK